MLYEMSIRSCRANVEASELFHSVSIVLFLIGVTAWVVSRYCKGRIRQAVGTSSAVPISRFELLAERRKETIAAHKSQICLSGPSKAKFRLLHQKSEIERFMRVDSLWFHQKSLP